MKINNAILLKKILIENFYVKEFEWNTPLVKLQPKFRLLAYLIELQTILSNQLHQEISLVGTINALEYTPNDVLKIIKNYND